MFRMVTQQLKAIVEIISSVVTFGEDVAASFVRRVAPLMEESEEILKSSVALTMSCVARLLEVAGDELRKAERAHRLERRKEKAARLRRDKAAKELYKTLSKARKTFEGFGVGTSELAIGLDAYVSKADPEVLARYGRETLDLLSEPDFELLGDVENPDTFNATEHADEIRPALLTLDAALKDLTLQKRQTQAAQKAKVDLLDTLKRTFIYGSRALEGLYVLSGQEFHAARLRAPFGPRADAGAAEIPLPGEDEEPIDDEPIDDEPTPENGEPIPADTAPADDAAPTPPSP